jgi:hypothetical protein
MAAKVLPTAMYSREEEKSNRNFVRNNFDLIHSLSQTDLLNSYVAKTSLKTALTGISDPK